MDQQQKERLKIRAETATLRVKYLGADLVRLLLFVGLALGILGVFAGYTPLPPALTIEQAPAVVNDTSRAISRWGAFTTPLFAFLIWQSI